VGIKFNDQHIPDSPHKVYMSPAMGDAHKLEVAQFPDSGVQPDKPYTFLVRKNGAKGELDGKVRYRPSTRAIRAGAQRATNLLAKERGRAVNNPLVKWRCHIRARGWRTAAIFAEYFR